MKGISCEVCGWLTAEIVNLTFFLGQYIQNSINRTCLVFPAEAMKLNLSDKQYERFKILKRFMKKEGIYIRRDSDVCWDYILFGDDAKFLKDPSKIAKKMAEAEYLHKYCDFQLGYDIAQDLAKNRAKEGQPPWSRQEWLEQINTAVLNTTELKAFPKQWPWQEKKFLKIPLPIP